MGMADMSLTKKQLLNILEEEFCQKDEVEVVDCI